MNHTQYLAGLAITAAGLLERRGCQIVALTAINGKPWIKAKMPSSITAEARRRLLADAWHQAAIIEWRA